MNLMLWNVTTDAIAPQTPSILMKCNRRVFLCLLIEFPSSDSDVFGL